MSYSNQPSISRWMPGVGDTEFDPDEKIIIHCGDRTITIRPCDPKSERGPDGPYPYIEVEAPNGKTGFPLSSKEKFDVMFDDLWRLSQ